jgi:excisionase family DNA binding protein
MTMNKDTDRIGDVMMKVHDVAEYLRLSEAKVYRMANSGQLPAMRFGKTWRFNKTIIDEWIRRETKGGNLVNSSGYVSE